VALGVLDEFDFAGLNACLSRLSSKQAKKLSRKLDVDPRVMFEEVLPPTDNPWAHSGSDLSSCTDESVETPETELVNQLLAQDAIRRVDVGTGSVATSADDEEDYSTVNSVGAVASSKQVDEEGEILHVETLYRALSYNPINP
jgi:hypothetical protein